MCGECSTGGGTLRLGVLPVAGDTAVAASRAEMARCSSSTESVGSDSSKRDSKTLTCRTSSAESCEDAAEAAITRESIATRVSLGALACEAGAAKSTQSAANKSALSGKVLPPRCAIGQPNCRGENRMERKWKNFEGNYIKSATRDAEAASGFTASLNLRFKVYFNTFCHSPFFSRQKNLVSPACKSIVNADEFFA